MVLEFSKHNYIDIDKIVSLRWFEQQGVGIVIFNGEKIVIENREHFDIIETGFIYSKKSYMCDDEMKKIRFIKKEEGE